MALTGFTMVMRSSERKQGQWLEGQTNGWLDSPTSSKSLLRTFWVWPGELVFFSGGKKGCDRVPSEKGSTRRTQKVHRLLGSVRCIWVFGFWIGVTQMAPNLKWVKDVKDFWGYPMNYYGNQMEETLCNQYLINHSCLSELKSSQLCWEYFLIRNELGTAETCSWHATSR